MTPAEAISSQFQKPDLFRDALRAEAARLHLAQDHRYGQMRALQEEVAAASGHLAAIDRLLELYDEHPGISPILYGVAESMRQPSLVTRQFEIGGVHFSAVATPTATTDSVLEHDDVARAAFQDAEPDASLLANEAHEEEPTVSYGDEPAPEPILVDDPPAPEQALVYGGPVTMDVEVFDHAERKADPVNSDRQAKIDAVSDKVRSTVWRMITHCAGESNEACFSVMRQATKYSLKTKDVRAGIEAWEAARFVEVLPYADATWIKLRILRR